MFVGPIVSWVSSWLLYGFVQLVENSDIISEEHKRVNKKHEKPVAKSNENKQAPLKKQIKVNTANLDFDEDGYIDITCANCKLLME